MDWKYRLAGSILFLLLLFSCAQVGVLNGGAKDEFAPKPVKMSPPNASTHFSASEISIEFDEYFKLNSPQENITVLPADLKVEAEVKKRKLVLKLVGEPSPNTTYQISFNNLVKDFSEGNDSLLQYVFSTGATLDSITYSGTVADAYSAQAMSQVLVALYHSGDSIQTQKPLYFTKTDAAGKFTMNYLKKGSYSVYLFQDDNKTLTYQNSEKAGFRTQELNLEQSIHDSIPLLLFPGKQAGKITTKLYSSPRLIRLKAGFPLFADSIFDNGKSIDSNRFYAYSPDSVLVLLEKHPFEEAKLVIQNQGIKDTLRFRVTNNNNRVSIPEIIPPSRDLSASKKVNLLFADGIKTVDTSLFIVQNKDSIKQPYSFTFSENQLKLKFADTLERDVVVILKKQALQFQNDMYSDSLHFDFIVKPERNFGALVLKSINLPEKSLLEVIKDKKVLRLYTLNELKANPKINWLEPGEYRFRIITDLNQNRKWDGGDVLRKIQAEEVMQFPETVKIRANWETEFEFEFNPLQNAKQ